ncbi:MAG: hypothetical protein RQ856_00360 [Candidatus Izemoplasmatales bacterium]|nr:hypothetical protein [Candidatus Izemoplasmatales bacterium]
MDPVLKKIKQEFSDFVKENKVKIKHQKSNNIEILTVLPNTKNRKKNLKIDFIYLKEAVAVDVKITYQIKLDNKNDKLISYAFSNLNKNLELPVIDPDLIPSIKENFKYEVIDGKIMSTIPAEKQIDTFTIAVKNSWNMIINHLNTFS